MTPDTASVAVRVIVFVALFQAAGIVIFLRLFGKQLRMSKAAIRHLGMLCAAVGTVALLIHQLIDAARMADEWSGIADQDLQVIAWTSSNASYHITAAAGLVLIGAGMAITAPDKFKPALAGVSLAGVVLATSAFLLTGHTSVHKLRWMLAPLLSVHLLIVAFWFGALLPLALVAKRESNAIAAAVVGRFSTFAGWLVPFIAIVGIPMAWILAEGQASVLRQPYGQLLLSKLAGFMLLMFLAAFNKLRLTPAIAAGVLSAPTALRRAILAEYIVIIAVLGVTATLTTFYSPTS